MNILVSNENNPEEEFGIERGIIHIDIDFENHSNELSSIDRWRNSSSSFPMKRIYRIIDHHPVLELNIPQIKSPSS